MTKERRPLQLPALRFQPSAGSFPPLPEVPRCQRESRFFSTRRTRAVISTDLFFFYRFCFCSLICFFIFSSSRRICRMMTVKRQLPIAAHHFPFVGQRGDSRVQRRGRRFRVLKGQSAQIQSVVCPFFFFCWSSSTVNSFYSWSIRGCYC